MANANRKARKAAGVKFERAAKVGTPVEERAWFAAVIPGFDRLGLPVSRRRSEKARKRALADRGIGSGVES
jgi:hypothetical protein